MRTTDLMDLSNSLEGVYQIKLRNSRVGRVLLSPKSSSKPEREAPSYNIPSFFHLAGTHDPQLKVVHLPTCHPMYDLMILPRLAVATSTS